MTKPYRPMLADDMDLAKLKFPCGAQPKVDGVRLQVPFGQALGRPMKPHANRFTTARYSRDEFIGLDGEGVVGDWMADDACRATTSAFSTILGEPESDWYIFDLVNDHTRDLPYAKRYQAASEKVEWLHANGFPFVKLMPMEIVHSLEELLALEETWLTHGFEGAITRNLDAKHKQGRSTIREGGLLRLKRFYEAEAVIAGFEEALTNNNEAYVDERGFTKRSDHAENKEGAGRVGKLLGVALQDAIDPRTGRVLFCKGDKITIGPGNATHDELIDWFNNPHKILDQVVKYKFFPKGIKDKPRFPTFRTIRALSDLAPELIEAAEKYRR
jgi:DNA ligase-1